MSSVNLEIPTTDYRLPATDNSAPTRAEKYERLAFTFCKMGTTGLIAWLLTPPIFVLIVAVTAIALYAKAVTLGLLRSRCVLRRPLLIIGFWAIVAVADAAWLFLV